MKTKIIIIMLVVTVIIFIALFLLSTVYDDIDRDIDFAEGKISEKIGKEIDFAEGKISEEIDKEIDFARSKISEIVEIESSELEYKEKTGNSQYVFIAESGETFYYDTIYNYLSVILYSRGGSYPKDPETSLISIDTAKNNASKYIDKYYPNKNINKEENIEKSELFDHGSHKRYHLYWREKINGIKGPNFVHLIVNPYNGNVDTYTSRYVEVTAPTTPLITEEEVIAMVKKELKDSVISGEIENIDAELSISVDSESGKDYLRWTVKVKIGRKVELEHEVELEGFDNTFTYTYLAMFEFNAITGERIH